MPSGHRPPVPPGYARVAIQGTFYGHAFTNVFYLQLTGTGITSTDLNSLAGDIAADWNTDIAPQASTNLTLTEVQITYVPSVGAELIGVWTGSHAGTSAYTDVDSSAACYVVNWAINAYYRGGHPRWYFPGPAANHMTNASTLDGTIRSAIATAFTNLMNATNARTTTNISAVAIGTMSFASGNAWRGTPVFHAFKSCAVRAVIGTQRRRLKS